MRRMQLRDVCYAIRSHPDNPRAGWRRTGHVTGQKPSGELGGLLGRDHRGLHLRAGARPTDCWRSGSPEPSALSPGRRADGLHGRHSHRQAPCRVPAGRLRNPPAAIGLELFAEVTQPPQPIVEIKETRCLPPRAPPSAINSERESQACRFGEENSFQMPASNAPRRA